MCEFLCEFLCVNSCVWTCVKECVKLFNYVWRCETKLKINKPPPPSKKQPFEQHVYLSIPCRGNGHVHSIHMHLTFLLVITIPILQPVEKFVHAARWICGKIERKKKKNMPWNSKHTCTCPRLSQQKNIHKSQNINGNPKKPNRTLLTNNFVDGARSVLFCPHDSQAKHKIDIIVEEDQYKYNCHNGTKNQIGDKESHLYMSIMIHVCTYPFGSVTGTWIDTSGRESLSSWDDDDDDDDDDNEDDFAFAFDLGSGLATTVCSPREPSNARNLSSSTWCIANIQCVMSCHR